MSVHDTQNSETREAAMTAATEAVREGKLIVLPTDTVYGIGADAFTPEAVTALQEAKGRGRDTPPPVLVGDHAVLLALAVDVPDYAERLTEEFWPGPLTLILKAQPSLTWDLGETGGTVALRMPDHEIALELLRRTGPLAVSSANRHGRPAAVTVLDAATQLGDAVEEYIDGGPSRLATSSTIIDTTVEPAEIVREGTLTAQQIIDVVGDIFTAPESAASGEESASAADEAAAPEADGSADPAATEQPGTADGPEGAEATAPSATAGTDGAEGTDEDGAAAADGPGAGVLDLPSEPDLVELSTETAAPDPGPDAPDPAPGGETGADSRRGPEGGPTSGTDDPAG